MNLGPMELLVIFVVALLVFGPKKLPELGKSLGKGLQEFRRASANASISAAKSCPESPEDLLGEKYAIFTSVCSARKMSLKTSHTEP